MADITELILAEHQRILTLHTALSRVPRDGSPSPHSGVLPRLWGELACLMETIMDAEEEIYYPAAFGTTPPERHRLDQAVAAHNDIREAVAEARLQPAQSPLWWRAVIDAVSACFEHLDHDERHLLTGFQQHASPTLRRVLARQWSAFLTARLAGQNPSGPDPGN